MDCAVNLFDGWQSELKLGDCMLQLFNAGLWTDISFRCLDQSEENFNDRIHAHKIVLAARSPVFQAMFFGPCQDRKIVIEIQDAMSQDFKLFLRLLYSDQHETVDEYDDLINVLDIAHKYQVSNIVDTCCRKLAELIDEENACSILERSLLFENKYLIKRATNFIDANADSVLQDQSFLDTSLICLAYILKGDTFYAEESEIFERAIEWAKRKCKSTDGQILRSTLGEAFFYLRTPCMSLKDFVACTHRKGFYTVEEYEDIMAVIGLYEQMKPKCNSTQKRYPVDLEIKRLPFANEKSNDKNTFIINASITETILIDSFVDLYLTSVTLFCKSHFVYPGTLYDGRPHFSEAEPLSVFEMPNLPLSVSLELEDTPPIKLMAHVSGGPTKPRVQLSKPFFFSAGKSITLKIEVKPDKIPNFQLRARKCLSLNELPNTVPGTVALRTEMNGARVVHSLRFKCVNNRD